jgi:hypothetical protein
MIRSIKLMAITLFFASIISCKKDPVANVTPTVSITTPSDNAIFVTGENIIITSMANDADGSISKVEFYDGTTLLGTATFSPLSSIAPFPYTYTWANASPGNHIITVKAIDNSGAVTTSSPINITVNIGFKATLNGASERPNPNASTATGSSIASFNITTKILNISTIYTGITPTAGHIHTGAATVAGPIIFGFPSLAPPIVFTTIPLTTVQEADLMGNLLYVNLHTAAFPGGEIRGQLIKQ